jgi:hypothetical protein
MSYVIWRRFRSCIPKNGSTIIIEDHEGNMSIGEWIHCNEFKSLVPFPIGKPMKWSYIVLVECPLEDPPIRAFYENGEEIDLDSLYDFTPL